MKLKTLFRLSVLITLCSLLAGCPKIYMAFEKHGGYFLAEPKGPQFIHIQDRDWDQENNALLYFYRPLSDWGSEEIDSPSIYIDDRRYFGMRSNGYTWLEVAPGTRRLTIRRPIGLLLGFEGFGPITPSMILDTDITIEPGEIYYFRYSEVSQPSEPNPELDADSPLASGDMQLVTSDVAFPEIVETRFMKNRPPFAKNAAAVSIAEQNRMDDFASERERLNEMKEEELVALKEAGHWRDPKWYWPLGEGSPTKRVKADRELRKLDKQEQAFLKTLPSEEEEDSEGWWPL